MCLEKARATLSRPSRGEAEILMMNRKKIGEVRAYAMVVKVTPSRTGTGYHCAAGLSPSGL